MKNKEKSFAKKCSLILQENPHVKRAHDFAWTMLQRYPLYLMVFLGELARADSDDKSIDGLTEKEE